MELCTQLYIRKIVNTIINNLKQNHSTMLFVKHYSALNIPFGEIKNSVDKSNADAVLLYHEFSLGGVQEAYAPFLSWIRHMYREYYAESVSAEEFVEQANVYSQTRSVIRSYIETGVCRRDEDIIIVEANYERQMLLNSLCNILEFISHEHTLFLVLNKLHFAEQSTLIILYEILKRKFENISLLANYNEAYSVPVYAHEDWFRLIEEAELQNLLLDWNFQGIQQEIPVDTSSESIKIKLEKHLVEINNLVMTLATDQALYYLDIIYHRTVTEKNTISKKLMTDFFELYIYASVYREHTTAALMICEKLKILLGHDANPKDLFKYYYLLCLVQIYSKQYASAEKTAKELSKVSEKIDEEEYTFKTGLIYLMITLKGFQSILRWNSCLDESLYVGFIEQAKRFGYYNHLAHIYTFGYCNERKYYSDDKNEYEIPVAFLNGIEIARQLGNKNLLFTAWQKNVLMAQGYGYYQSVDYYYKKCLEIIADENSKIQEAAIYNGLGYNRIVSEQIREANDYFNQALEIYIKCKENYYIAETLYNKATNAMLAEEYEDAYELLLIILKILKAIKMNRMNVCNLSKLYGLLVLCSYRMGISYNANFYLNQMGRMLRHVLKPDGEAKYFLWDDDLFLYYFTSGLLAKSDDIELAQRYFDKAKFHMFRSDGFLFLSYPQFAMEQAELYKLQNEPEKAKDILEKCIEYCNKNGFKNKERILFAKLQNQPVVRKHIPLGISIDEKHQIENLYKIKAMEIELSEKNKGLNFLLSWQELLNRDNLKVDLFIEDAITTIQNNYNIDRILYVEIQNGKPVIMYKNSDMEINDTALQTLTKYFDNHRKEFVVSRFEKSFYDYSHILSIFGMNQVLSFACIPMTINDNLYGYMIALIGLHDNMTGDITFLGQNDLTIFKFALKQMTDALYRLKTRIEINNMNKRLQKSAVTDFLTGLLNRNGFSKKIGDYEREKKNRSLPDIPFVVLYIDLDNFKYCNDTFGHDVGDIILKQFSYMFEDVAGKDGYCVRYGGDEFVIVLPNKTLDDGIETAKRIYAYIEEKDHFVPDIEHHIHTSIDVADESKVSCSIGIAAGDVYDSTNMSIVLKHADTTLYDVKKNNKRNYRVWKDDMEEPEIQVLNF